MKQSGRTQDDERNSNAGSSRYRAERGGDRRASLSARERALEGRVGARAIAAQAQATLGVSERAHAHYIVQETYLRVFKFLDGFHDRDARARLFHGEAHCKLMRSTNLFNYVRSV
jgi:hypothetical protein